MYMYINIYIYIYVYMNIHICMYEYTYRLIDIKRLAVYSKFALTGTYIGNPI